MAAGEGAQVPPGGDEAGQRPDAPVAIGGGSGPEGPFGQVEQGIGIVAGPQQPELQVGGSQPSFSMISSGTE